MKKTKGYNVRREVEEGRDNRGRLNAWKAF